MSALESNYAPDNLAIRLLNPLQPLFALGARLFVSWQFLKSGYIKITNWDSTLYLYENEYHTPLLPPHAAAVAGAFGELFFPALLVVGLFGRLSALGLFAARRGLRSGLGSAHPVGYAAGVFDRLRTG